MQQDLQEMMQDLVGIVRKEDEMQQALEGLDELRQRAAQVPATGNREYNPGWHTALDLDNLLTVSEAITRAGHRPQGEPRRPVPRRLPEEGRRSFGKVNMVVRKGRRRPDAARGEPIPEMPAELKQIIEEMK